MNMGLAHKIEQMMSVSEDQYKAAKAILDEMSGDRALRELTEIARIANGDLSGGSRSEEALLILGEIRGRLRKLAAASLTVDLYREGRRQVEEARRREAEQ